MFTNKNVVVTELTLKAPADVYDTVSMYKKNTVNLGVNHQAEIGVKKVNFVNGVITN